MSGTKAGINPGRSIQRRQQGPPSLPPGDWSGGQARHGCAWRLSGFRLPLPGDQALLFLFTQWRARHEPVYRGIQSL